MDNLKGIFTALLTPFQEDGTMNERALEQLIERCLAQGITGFYVGGSTAEAFLMDVAERKKLLETVMAINAGRGRILSHVGAISTHQAVELAQHAASLGVDAVSAVAPFYYKFTLAEIKQYYYDIVGAVDKPMLIYNFPAHSGVSFPIEDMIEMLQDERFMGVKHTSNDFYGLERLKSAFPDKIFYNGYDEMFLSGLAMGADGGVGSTYNFMADKFVAMRRLFREGKLAEARAIQADVNAIIQALIKVGVFAGEKAVLELLGIDFGPCRKPFSSADAQQKKYLEKTVLPLL